MAQREEEQTWQQSACILCECNCGIEVQVGEDRRFTRIRGDRAHPASHGYTCNKALQARAGARRVTAQNVSATALIAAPWTQTPVQPAAA